MKLCQNVGIAEKFNIVSTELFKRSSSNRQFEKAKGRMEVSAPVGALLACLLLGSGGPEEGMI